jgi:hypothetical protein
LGYAPCAGDELEAGLEKVALYADEHGEWTHAAPQLPDGWWTSKLGPEEDILHRTPWPAISTGKFGRSCSVRGRSPRATRAERYHRTAPSRLQRHAGSGGTQRVRSS